MEKKAEKIIEWRKLKVKVFAPYASQAVLEDAMRLVDQIWPQKWGPNGLHEYYRGHREHLLNLFLWFHGGAGAFPEGWVCFTQAWPYERVEGVSGWVVWSGNKFDPQPGFWVKVPPLLPRWPDGVTRDSENFAESSPL